MPMVTRDYKIRTFIVIAFFGFIFSVILARLFVLQIYQKEFFKDLAQSQYEVEIKVTPQRAPIFDQSGSAPLAFNKYVDSAFIVPHQFSQPAKTKAFLQQHYPEVAQRLAKNPGRYFLWLERKLSSEKGAFLRAEGTPDILFTSELQRFYPYEGTAQLLGYTDIDNEGIAGIELKFSKQLQGKPTTMRVEKDARSGLSYFNKKTTQTGQKSQALTLTIDSSLQSIVHHEVEDMVKTLNAKLGSALIINPDNGHVVSMSNWPEFDPNRVGVPSMEMMKNPIVNECYELGSVMKAFCAMAALEEGVVKFDEDIDCEGRYAFIDGVRVENPTIGLLNKLKETNNILPFNQVVRYSSNVGIAKIAKRLGPKYYDHLRRLGFGTKTGIQFPGERAGFVNHPSKWSKPSIIVMSFGYELMATVMQLGKAFSIIANNGYDVQPTMVKTAKCVAEHRQLYKPETIMYMKNIMEKVAEKHQIPGFRIMGKTGTARCIKDGRYSAKDHRYTFAGIIEKGDYRRVIVTFISEPEKANLWASETALPLFSRIAQRMLVHDAMHHRLELC
jgi:cell division protein FtsI (penicillin-binding protein 3)